VAFMAVEVAVVALGLIVLETLALVETEQTAS
jgi:hypothetical protein